MVAGYPVGRVIAWFGEGKLPEILSALFQRTTHISFLSCPIGQESEHSAQISGHKYCARAEIPTVDGRGDIDVKRPRAKRPIITITTAKSNPLCA